MNMNVNMNDFAVSLEVMEKAYPYIRNIDNELTLSCCIGTIIDQWIADHDKSFEVGDEILKGLLAVREHVFEAEGMMSKTV